jgi:hypothetical protein
MRTESEVLIDAAKHIRELCDKQWMGSKGHHTGMINAAVILEKLAKEKQQEQTN